MSISSVLQRGKAFLTPRSSFVSLSPSNAPEETLFPKVDPAIDGDDCDYDCASCEVRLPKGWKIDEDEKLYGHVNGWATHMLVATGKTDWVRDVSDEKGSVMAAVRDCKVEPGNGKLMLSASNLPLPSDHHTYPPAERPTTVLILPAFAFLDNVTPDTVPLLIRDHISLAPTTTTPLKRTSPTQEPSLEDNSSATAAPAPIPSPSPFVARQCPHRYIILLCSQRTRDARCGQSAPLLKREFERHLRPLGLYRDLQDQRPGGVGIYFISHVGGHKFSANCMIYRRTKANKLENGENSNGNAEDGILGEGSQCIWLARVRPEDCEGLIKFTVLQGKVVKPERQLRGGFDRQKGLVSW